MRISIDLRLSQERITAQLGDGTVVFDDIAMIAVKPQLGGKPILVGIGSERFDREGTTVLPVVSQIDFQPGVAASIANLLVLRTWNDLRPWFRGFQGVFDHIDVRVALVGPTARECNSFSKALPYHPQFTWWVNGDKVKF